MHSFWPVSLRLPLAMGPLPCEPSSGGSPLSRHLALPCLFMTSVRTWTPQVFSRTVKSMFIQIYQKKNPPSMSKKLSLLGNLRLHQLPDTVAVFFSLWQKSSKGTALVHQRSRPVGFLFFNWLLRSFRSPFSSCGHFRHICTITHTFQ